MGAPGHGLLPPRWGLRFVFVHPPGSVLLWALAAGLLVGPFVLAAPSRFFADVLLFQSLRPGDGALDRLSRLHELFHERRLVGVGLALLGERWFQSRFVQRFPPPGQGGLDLWAQVQQSSQARE